MKTNIGITEENREKVVIELSKILADEYLLYTKTRNAHWNVEGIDFYDKHRFFEVQFEQLNEFIDDIAERIRILRHYTPASLSTFLKLTHLAEASRNNNDSIGFINELLLDHESIILNLRKNINRFANEFNDLGTSDFITSLMQEHEKMAWFLRAHNK